MKISWWRTVISLLFNMYQVGVKFHNNVIFQMIISVQFVMFGKKLKVINKSFCNIIIRIPVALPISDEINLFQPNKNNECDLAFHTILCNCGPTIKKAYGLLHQGRQELHFNGGPFLSICRTIYFAWRVTFQGITLRRQTCKLWCAIVMILCITW